jgi:hypothetical protein
MSEWLRLTNEIKRSPVDSLLTPVQQAIRDQLVSLLRFPKWANLYGVTGSGKTLVAWALARATGAIYLPSPDVIDGQDGRDGLIIDNAPLSENDVRRVFAHCNLISAYTVLLITKQPITMPMSRVELSLPNEADLAFMIRSLARLSYHCDTKRLPPQPNFWNILQACV